MFPDCPGCQTFGETRKEALNRGQEALKGWLEAHLATRRVPQRPVARRGTAIRIGAKLAAVLQIRWAREDEGLTQSDVAKRAGVSQQQIAKLEDPDGNPTLVTFEKVAAALGLQVDVVLTAA